MDGTTAIGVVVEIRAGELRVRHSDDGDIYSHRLDGRFRNQLATGFNLLLPAIKPEGAPAGMHPKVRQALVSMADLWGAFAGDIQTGLLDPCGGGCFLLDGARIACSYQSREAALAECRQIIESIDHLLEGGAR